MGAPLTEKRYHGKTTSPLSDQISADLFSLTFFPEEMKQALEVQLKDIRLAKVYCNVGRVGGVLERAASFPFAQHMLSDSPGQRK